MNKVSIACIRKIKCTYQCFELVVDARDIVGLANDSPLLGEVSSNARG